MELCGLHIGEIRLKMQGANFSNMIIMIKIIILSEGSQTGKDKHHMILLTCGISKK